MKNFNLIEKVGMVLGIIGAIIIVLKLYFEDSSFGKILAFDQLEF